MWDSEPPVGCHGDMKRKALKTNPVPWTFLFRQWKRNGFTPASFSLNLVIVNSIFGLCFLWLSRLCGLAFLIISIISYFGHADTAAFGSTQQLCQWLAHELHQLSLKCPKCPAGTQPQGTSLTLLPPPNPGPAPNWVSATGHEKSETECWVSSLSL